jgi:hypothetical protein
MAVIWNNHHGQKQQHNSITTKTTVGIGRKCINRQNMTLAETRTLQWQQCHALHPCPNSNVRAQEDDDNGPAGSVGCGDHFGGVGALMGSGAMTTTTTKIDDNACPHQVVIAV